MIPYYSIRFSIIVVIVFGFHYGSVAFADTTHCEITSLPAVTIVNAELTSYAEDTWSTSLVINNTSSFIIPDMYVGIGVYDDDMDLVPKFWITLPDTYTLRANTNQKIDITVGTKYLPEGEYAFRVFIAQGDVFAPLGLALTEVPAPTVKVIKTTTPLSLVTTVAQLAGGYNDSVYFSPLKFNVVVENKSIDTPLRDVRAMLRIGKGMSPIGAAVQSEVVSELRVLPGRKNEIVASADSIEPGPYTAVAMVVGGEEVMPLVLKRETIAGGAMFAGTPYVSVIGITSFPYNTTAKAIACIARLGASDSMTPLITNQNEKVVLRVLSEKGDIGEMTSPLTPDHSGVSEQISVELEKQNLQELYISAALYEERYGHNMAVAVSTSTLPCAEVESCTETNEVPPSKKTMATVLSPVIFFEIALILTIIMVAYIIIRFLLMQLKNPKTPAK